MLPSFPVPIIEEDYVAIRCYVISMERSDEKSFLPFKISSHTLGTRDLRGYDKTTSGGGQGHFDELSDRTSTGSVTFDLLLDPFSLHLVPLWRVLGGGFGLLGEQSLVCIINRRRVRGTRPTTRRLRRTNRELCIIKNLS